MIRGPKPKPTELKLALGNPGKRPLNRREPKPKQCIPLCPDFLDADAKAEWHRITPLLAANGVITELDGPAIAAYCVVYSRWFNAERQTQQYGTVILSPDKKVPIQSPYLAIANRALDQMVRMLAEFGMTPSSRSRIQTAAPEAANDKSFYFEAG